MLKGDDTYYYYYYEIIIVFYVFKRGTLENDFCKQHLRCDAVMASNWIPRGSISSYLRGSDKREKIGIPFRADGQPRP